MPGRNGPCPCGSGKKYKKCCFRHDQARQHAEPDLLRPEDEEVGVAESDASLGFSEAFGPLDKPSGPSILPPAKAEPPKETDPHTAALNARWDEFESADYDGQVKLFLKTLDEPELMDGEMAAGMLEQLFQAGRKRGDLDRFEILVRAVQERLPEVFEQIGATCLSYLIDARLAQGRTGELGPLAREMGPYAGSHIDHFNRVLDQIAYHAPVATVLEMMRIGWPGARGSREIVPWGIGDYADRATLLEMLAWCRESEDAPAEESELLARVTPYGDGPDDLNVGAVEEYVAHVSGRVETPSDWRDVPEAPEFPERDETQAGKAPDEQGAWDEEEAAAEEDRWDDDDSYDEDADEAYDEQDYDEDYDEEDYGDDWDEEQEEEPPDPRSRWCYLLGLDFLGYLHRTEGWDYARAQMAQTELTIYFQRRLRGKLRDAPELYEPGQRPSRSKGKKGWNRQQPYPILCPDRPSFEPFLAGHMRFLASRYHRVAATMEAVPAWLRFLESRGLIDGCEHATARERLARLHRELLKLWAKFPEDPSLHAAAVEAWKEQQPQEGAPAG